MLKQLSRLSGQTGFSRARPESELPGVTQYPAYGPAGRLRWTAVSVFLLAIVAGYSTVQAAECDEVFLTRIQEVYQAMTSFAGRFEQEDLRTNGERTLAQGTIAYLKPGRMRWDYDPPHEQLVVTDGETVWLFDPLLDNVIVQPLADLTQGTPLAFLLGVGDLTEDFRCRPHTREPPSDGLKYVELVPIDEIPTLDFIQIGADPVTAALEVLFIVDTQGNLRKVSFLDLEREVKFPQDHFMFLITDEMEVITK